MWDEVIELIERYDRDLKTIFSDVFDVSMDSMFWVVTHSNGVKYELRAWLDPEKTACVTLLSIPLDVKGFIQRWRREYVRKNRRKRLQEILGEKMRGVFSCGGGGYINPLQ